MELPELCTGVARTSSYVQPFRYYEEVADATQCGKHKSAIRSPKDKYEHNYVSLLKNAISAVVAVQRGRVFACSLVYQILAKQT